MAIVDTLERVVQNKSSPESIDEHALFYLETVISRLNSLGKMARVETKTKNGKLLDQTSGLLHHIVKDDEKGKAYHIIDSNTGEMIILSPARDKKVTLFRWYDMYKPDRHFQFLPLNSKGQITFDIRSIRMVAKVTSDKSAELIAEHIDSIKKQEKRK